ncbi:retrovirus-related pol polyprotein from transposon TNT 1-94, partial [Tanacetum coccineum]
YSQEEGTDYDETFALVARIEAIGIFLTFSTYMNFKVFQMDVKSVFLNVNVKEEVYVKQPPCFESGEFPNYVCKLDKALYGLKQAPKAWFENLLFSFITNLLEERLTTHCLSSKQKDMFYLSKCKWMTTYLGQQITNFVNSLKKRMTKKFKMSMMDELTYFFRFQIKQDDIWISICQEKYTRDLLKKYEISDSSSVKTPMLPPNTLGPNLSGKPFNETMYRGMIGSLMYLTTSRPDIQFSTILCARYQANPKDSTSICS